MIGTVKIQSHEFAGIELHIDELGLVDQRIGKIAFVKSTAFKLCIHQTGRAEIAVFEDSLIERLVIQLDVAVVFVGDTRG